MSEIKEKHIPTLESIIKVLKEHTFTKYHISSLALFGSYVQGKATENSDIDILVDFDRPIGLEIVDLKDELETILGIPVSAPPVADKLPDLRPVFPD
ncbi:MAG: nucleotidyltransferase domain-containing protein [Methanospirillaceae archaeon]|nr:nucleotidyltransferase domain-containing protein [Methanospirillaceae archaeon]